MDIRPDSSPFLGSMDAVLFIIPDMPMESTPLVSVSSTSRSLWERLRFFPIGTFSHHRFHILCENTFRAGQQTTRTPTLWSRFWKMNIVLSDKVPTMFPPKTRQ